jgi:hypothetical protein
VLDAMEVRRAFAREFSKCQIQVNQRFRAGRLVTLCVYFSARCAGPQCGGSSSTVCSVPKPRRRSRNFRKVAVWVVDGVVGPLTWAALPNGAPMPRLQEGSIGEVVKSLQQVLTTGAPGVWNTAPGAIDGSFDPSTKASVQAFQTWGGVTADGIVGDQTWGVQLGAAGATLESQVGLQYAI